MKIVFVCCGNICRSPYAEYIFKDIMKKAGLSQNFVIESRATSNEAIGMKPHRETLFALNEEKIIVDKLSVQLKKSDYDKYDLFVGMDAYNRRDMVTLFNGDMDEKVHLLLDYSDEKGDIDDPWYTRDFQKAFKEIKKGCEALFNKLRS